MINKALPKAVSYDGERLFFLDQTRLPLEVIIEEQKDVKQVWASIKMLKVRGAPAIGIAGAYGVLLAAKLNMEKPFTEFKKSIIDAAEYLNTSRPTAVNLSYAVKRMAAVCENYNGDSVRELFLSLEKEANTIYAEDVAICRSIGKYGAALIKEGMGVLTHCNAGALAVSERGTALAPIYEAWENGRRFKVYADETRPLLQGARLTAWELLNSGVDVTLICDNMAAHTMSRGLIDMVIVGCDRVARNGDTANKIGTMSVAIAAKYFGIPFYVACPSSTYDYSTLSGKDIIIEERSGDEVTSFGLKRTAPEGVKTMNPAFDVTPADLISGFVTEKGIILPSYDVNLPKVFGVGK